MTAFNQTPHRIPRTLISATLLAVLALALSGCPGPTPVPVEQHGLQLVEFDTVWVLGSEHYHRIMVRAYPVAWGAGRELRCQITGQNVGAHIHLYDDGGNNPVHDSEGFADTLSGDPMGGDGVYTRLVNDRFAGAEGRYNFTFAFTDTPSMDDTLYASIRITRNSPPVVVAFSAPDSIISGRALSANRVRVVALDSDGQSDITSVKIVAIDRSNNFEERFYESPMDRANDSTWTIQLPASIAVGKPTATYELRPMLQDWILFRSGLDDVMGDSLPIWLENLPPHAPIVTGPDTVWVPPSGTTGFRFDIRVNDDQTPLDLSELRMTLSRRNAADDADSALQPPYEYFDDGGLVDTTDLDTLAGDGVFTAGFSAHRGNLLNTPFKFSWNALDRANQSSDTTTTVMIILLEGNGSPHKMDEPNRAGGYLPIERTIQRTKLNR